LPRTPTMVAQKLGASALVPRVNNGSWLGKVQGMRGGRDLGQQWSHSVTLIRKESTMHDACSTVLSCFDFWNMQSRRNNCRHTRLIDRMLVRNRRLPAVLLLAAASREGTAGLRGMAVAAFRPGTPPSGRASARRSRAAFTATPSAVRRVVTSARDASSSSSPPAIGNDAAVEQMKLESEREMRRVATLYEPICADAAATGWDGPSSGSRQDTPKAARPALITTREQARELLAKVDTVLFDCDGVLYRWPDPIPGARECIMSLLRGDDNMGKQKAVYFVTNNAGTSRRQLCDKLNVVLHLQGDDDELSGRTANGSNGEGSTNNAVRVTEDMIISSSYSAARYLQQQQREDNRLRGNRLFVIGSLGLCQELQKAGFVIAGGGPSEPGAPTSMTREELAMYDFTVHDPIHAVVVGHDTDFNFRKLCIANVLLQRNPNAPLVATNEDPFDLVGADARHIPGNGCVVKALEHCSKRKAVNVGKPSQTLASLIARESGGRCVPRRTVIVGDRLDTDIKFGAETGMYSLLVLTGVTTADYLAKLGDGTEEEPLPTHIMSNVGLLA
jgi:HAD superfamily hydrolase (TIGR01450 family)